MTSDLPSTSDSSDESDSESGESEESELEGEAAAQKEDFEEDEDEEGAQPNTSSAAVRTKNEIVDNSIILPEIKTVDESEILERVGEIMSIIENMVIVKGDGSEVETRAAERALDSESLLVFEDRQVLGYVSQSRILCHLALIDLRCMKPSDPRISLYIRSNLHLLLISIPRLSKSLDPYSTFLGAANLFSPANSGR